MKDRTDISLYHLWRAVYPMLLYMLLQGLLLPVFRLFFRLFGAGSEAAVSDAMTAYLAFCGLVSLLLFGWIYRRDVEERKRSGTWREPRPMKAPELFRIAAGACAMALFGNNLVNLTPLMELSRSYQETSRILSSGSLWLQLLCVGALVPAAEEVVMRGLLYGRLRDMCRPAAAIAVSAVLFGLFHGNPAQGVYAAGCGWFLSWLMERFRTLRAPILAHLSSNVFISLLGGLDGYRSLSAGDWRFWALTAGGGIVTALAVAALRRE
ncbi:MAG: CPBP family intramembrane metalloprotease [Eubacteriales bacterium]|nr:CPBP family intramembrane metalloprotease [Eubacteriales bacterium]